MYEGSYLFKLIVRYWLDPDDMTESAIASYAQTVMRMINVDLRSEFNRPPNARYEGAVPNHRVRPWDNFLLDKDVTRLAWQVYRSAMADHSILEDEESLKEMFEDISRAADVFCFN